ncbi:MAG: response regulator transcription factor [Chitinophagaceae bacterium]|nr:response regulator transcription factor [Chitinophagaceae bacterium]
MKLRCIAIDDEPLALELLEDNIRQVSFLRLEKGFNKPLDALQYLQENEIDLVFLDIQMPGLTGLQFIRALQHKPLFIFITAYEQFALQGYELDVVDYLLKPVSPDRFIRACNKAREVLGSKQPAGNSTRDYLFVQADYRMIRVNFKDISWIEGMKDYVRFHLGNGLKPVVSRMNMKELDEQLPPEDFLRIHRSYIVSKKAISAVQKQTVFLQETELPVGDNYRDAVAAFVKS